MVTEVPTPNELKVLLAKRFEKRVMKKLLDGEKETDVALYGLSFEDITKVIEDLEVKGYECTKLSTRNGTDRHLRISYE